MQFNKITRGAKRAIYDEQAVYEILDAGFFCQVAFQANGQTMLLPTTYGRKDDCLYLHGSSKNFAFSQMTDGQMVCIGVSHIDGLVLARSLFDSSMNYRSVVLFGKATIVEDEAEKLEGLKIFTENLIKGRWAEVSVGTPSQLKATLVVKFQIESASAKVRSGGPQGDENLTDELWSGHIPLVTKALEPIQDSKFGSPKLSLPKSVSDFMEEHG